MIEQHQQLDRVILRLIIPIRNSVSVPLLILNGAGGLSIFLSKRPEFLLPPIFFSSRAKYNLINRTLVFVRKFLHTRWRGKIVERKYLAWCILTRKDKPPWMMDATGRKEFLLQAFSDYRVMGISFRKSWGEKPAGC